MVSLVLISRILDWCTRLVPHIDTLLELLVLIGRIYDLSKFIDGVDCEVDLFE